MEVLEYPAWQQIAVSFPEELRAGQTCELSLGYSSSLSHSYSGLYNSSYTDQSGARR